MASTSASVALPTQGNARRSGALLLAAVVIVASNLRMTITAVGPVLDRIGADEGLGPVLLGLLGALPLIVWGVASPAGHWLSVRVGLSDAVTLALLVLAGGTVWRSLPGAPGDIWVGTVLIGLGLAIANALLPAVIKKEFPARVPLVMGIYTSVLGGVASVGAGLSVPLADISLAGTPMQLFDGWRFALLAMGAPVPVAIIVWIIATRRTMKRKAQAAQAATGIESPNTGLVPVAPASSAGRRIWRDPLAWQVSLYMGAQSTVFYTLASWFVPYQIAKGHVPAVAGVEMMVFQLIGIAGSMILPVLMKNARVQRWAPAGIGVAALASWLGIPLAPAIMPLWLVLGGMAAGASLTMALTLTAERARTAEHASALSGMTQALGYSIAAAGPVFFGALLSLTGNWTLAFAWIWVAALGQSLLGVSLGRNRYVLDD